MINKENKESKENSQAEYEEDLCEVGNHLRSKLNTFEKQRQLGDKRRLSNYRQYKGSNEYLREKNDREGDDKQYRNKSFYPYTTLKVDQFKAKSLELFLPSGDKNFSLFPSNNPNIPNAKLKTIWANLVQRYGKEEAITDKVFNQAKKDYAMNSAKKMEDYLYDTLIENGYKDIIAQMALSGAVYGYGISIGPFVKKEKRSVKKTDEYGNVDFVNEMISTPYFEYCSVWDFYPDLNAKTLNQMEGAFINKILTRKELFELIKKKDFISENIREYLRCHPKGNYIPKDFETKIDNISNQNTDINESNRYRMYEYWGTVPYKFIKDYLKDTNQVVNEEDDEDFEALGDIEVNIAMIDNVIIKCILNPWHSQRRPYHIFNLSLTDGELFGVGIPEKTYELQRLLNALIRCTVDNTFMTSGPMFEINRDLIPSDLQIGPLGSQKIIVREGLGEEAGYPAIRQLNVTNNTIENMQLINMIKSDIDTITSLSGIQFGDLGGQASAGRTSSGLNQLQSGSNTILKDTCKNFDTANESMLSLDIETILLVTNDETLLEAGDTQVIAKVSKGILEKADLANKLIALNSSMRPEQMQYIDEFKLIKQMLSTQGLDPDELMLDPDTIEENKQKAMQQQQQMMQQQSNLQSQELQLKQQKASTDQMNAESKASLNQITEQKILNDMKEQQNKGQLNAILTAHTIDKDREDLQNKNQKAIGDLFSKEMDREHQYNIANQKNNGMQSQNMNEE